ncbi:MAG: PIN domain-containing protein [Trueperaceae bacterium]|nr:MAG: PIN domain-containing protein [Trueperaceae bacterium]
MSAFVDTSVLVRYLTGDPPEMLAAAKRIVDETQRLYLTGVVVAETAYVLTSFYEIPRTAVVDSLVTLLRKKNIGTYGLEQDLAIRSLLMCRSSKRISFADASVWAATRSAGADAVYTFDERFPTEGIELRRA